MKRVKLVILILLSLSLFICADSYAVDYTASASMPSPVGISPTINKVMGKGLNPSDWVGTSSNLDFGTLISTPWTDPVTLKSGLVFLPDHFFAIDVGYLYGSGTGVKSIQVSYTPQDTLPPTQHGLGYKSLATFMKKYIVGGYEKTEDVTTDVIDSRKYLLKDVQAGKTITLTTLGGGWLRVYVGIATLDPNATLKDSTAGTEVEVFSPGDTPSNPPTVAYKGSLTITALFI